MDVNIQIIEVWVTEVEAVITVRISLLRTCKEVSRFVQQFVVLFHTKSQPFTSDCRVRVRVRV